MGNRKAQGRIARAFATLRQERRCGLVAYITCGDPDVETTIEVAVELARCGADLIELGVPFSDPIADGHVIQGSSFRALQKRTSVKDVLAAAEAIRKQSEIPLIMFSYLNPLLCYGMAAFSSAAREAGVDGVLVTDLPLEAAASFRSLLRKQGLRSAFLVAPNTTLQRAKAIDRASDAFVYCLTTAGVTGERRELDPTLLTRLDSLRERITNPLVAGFGISTHQHYGALSSHCDAVVVGSAIVRAIAESGPGGEAAAASAVVREILGR